MVYKGKLPKKVEIADWNEDKYLSFFSFIKLFMEEKDGSYSYIVSSQNREAVKFIDKIFYKEFSDRLELKGCNDVRFKKRLTTFVRTVLLYLREKPFVVTGAMYKEMEHNDRLSWALKPFKIEKTGIGADVVVPNTDDLTDPDNQKHVEVANPFVEYQKATYSMLSLLKDILKDIKPSDIKRLDPKDKIKIAIQMIDSVGKTLKSPGGNVSIFKQINVNTTGREDLEKMALDYSEE